MPLTWNWNPLIAAALLLPTWAYAHGVMHLWRGGSTGRGVRRWQVGAFMTGLFTLFIALMSPIDTLGADLLSAHMIQHLLLMIVAPPLMVAATPPAIFLWAFSLRLRRSIGRWTAPHTVIGAVWRLLTRPLVAWGIHGAVIWLWHIPSLYQSALIDSGVHTIEHASFYGSAVLFWAAALSAHSPRHFVGALMIFTTALHSSILGALMTFGENVWYPLYVGQTAAWGLSPLDDQRLAGLIMWIPAGVIYLIAALALLGIGLHRMDHTRPQFHNAT